MSPAEQTRRLARLRELANEQRKAERALNRALAREAQRFSYRELERATGLSRMTIARRVTGAGE